MDQDDDDRPGAFRRVPDGGVSTRFRGCLLGGAVGDALGAPVEFLKRDAIVGVFGQDGIRDMAPAYGRVGAITDDTQMTLFTAEGLLRAHVRGAVRGICHAPSVVAYAYLRWLHTQGVGHPLHTHCLDGWLLGHRALFARRAPGVTCMSALRATGAAGDPARNDSKGCGGVMRVAPVGMYFAALAGIQPQRRGAFAARAFELGCEAAGLTHGHPTGRLAAGAFALIVFDLLTGVTLEAAAANALRALSSLADHAEASAAIEKALRLAAERPAARSDAIAELGEGWIAEEALAIGLYCALGAPDFESGVVLAVNHDGDSDSTGLIAGHLLGAIHGVDAIPARWLAPLELRDVIEEVADDLATVTEWGVGDCDAENEEAYYVKRYPGS